ncbi:hypothetical protein LMA04_02315 [Pseudescherichia vulneris]|uniref:hypothetical protein n=1 Tax=Pseudescherichia vulneris TaxID=566 RepID=UPI00227A5D8F|nr:hypothetical protein [Pseudescherichia vulneris]WAH52911.1 hypothetical protein LMA04_02315 [Pseudescherichia vulneris]
MIKNSVTLMELQRARGSGAAVGKRSELMYPVDSRAKSFTPAMIAFIMETLLQLAQQGIKRDTVVRFQERHYSLSHNFIYQPFLIIFAH